MIDPFNLHIFDTVYDVENDVNIYIYDYIKKHGTPLPNIQNPEKYNFVSSKTLEQHDKDTGYVPIDLCKMRNDYIEYLNDSGNFFKWVKRLFFGSDNPFFARKK